MPFEVIKNTLSGILSGETSVGDTVRDVYSSAAEKFQQLRPGHLDKALGAPENFIFPASLAGRGMSKSSSGPNIDHPFVKITFYTWMSQLREASEEFSTLSEQANVGLEIPKLSEKIIGNIYLAIPEASIVENFSHDWTDALDWSIGSKALMTMGLGAALQSALQSKTIATLAPFLQNAGETAFAAFGYRLNDLHALSYKGLSLRSFQYIFNLIPKNAEESQLLKRMIDYIKDVTTPDYSGVVVSYPAICDVSVFAGNGNLLYRTMLSGVKQFDINYAPQTYMKTFKDGTPTQVTISLNIQELRRLDKRMIDRRV